MSISSINNDRCALIDHKSKMIMFWTPRAACTTSVSTFYKNMGTFDTVIKKFPWIHNHRDTHFYGEHGRITVR